ncbi:VQ motif containing protein [Parasponia andersonii]|uniref:VQ motif containing protein n=1 Tax=Parasponia andersonii TaxID=3476 RepID=A0A2P5C1T9_PARAD|nr:VQ motif containing protein [Parasponia andersonii]
MDSGNSGSMQSSSGGDEEYDSRAESISALLSTNPAGHMASHHAPPHPHHQQRHQSSLFDPLSNFFDPTAASSRSQILNLDMVWPRTLRSDPNSTDLGAGLMPSSSPSSLSTQNQVHPFLTNSQLGQGQNRGGGIGISAGAGAGIGVGLGGVGVGSSNTFPGIQIPPERNAPRGTNPVVVSDSSVPQNDTNNNVVRNPKKRSRASRRAPTTVLNTDTTNFRAMVQEFTGIPAPPFTSSPFPRTTRLDLFGTTTGVGGGGSSMMRSGPLDSPPPYLLRPFPQKVQAPPQMQQTTSFVPPTTSSSSTTSLLSSCNTMASTSTAINYQQSPSGGGGGQNHLLLQNPVLNFHSLLQAQAQQPKFPLSKPQLGPLDHQISHHHELEDQFGLGNHGLGGLPNLMSSELPPPRSDDNHHSATTATTTTTTATTNWGSSHEVGVAGSNDNNRSGNDNNNSNVDHHSHNHHQQGLLMRSINGGLSSTSTTTNGKLNYSASSSDFHGGKGSENVTTARCEGMVESWICSSD